MADTYQQPRKSKNSDYDVPQMQKDFAIGMGATAAGVTGMMGTLMLSTLKETPAEKKIREARKKAREEKEKKVKKKTTSPGRGGGGGGGFGKFSTIQRGLGTGSKKLPKKDLM